MSDTLWKNIEKRLEELDLSPRAASIKAGRSPDFLRKVKQNSGQMPHMSNLTALAEALETTVDELLGKAPVEANAQPSKEAASAAELPRAAPVAAMSMQSLQGLVADLPVYGTANGSLSVHKEGGFEMEARVIEYVRRPPAFFTVPDAYAIYVAGNSMFPKHGDGELRFIHPHRPPRIGDSVVVQAEYHPGAGIEAYIGDLLRRTGDKIVIAKLHPKPAEIEFDLQHVKAVHRVLTMAELFGV